ncbi:MAG TPA: hypothetical protein VIV12_25640 [Streptosporangiaceae bacterium]
MNQTDTYPTIEQTVGDEDIKRLMAQLEPGADVKPSDGPQPARPSLPSRQPDRPAMTLPGIIRQWLERTEYGQAATKRHARIVEAILADREHGYTRNELTKAVKEALGEVHGKTYRTMYERHFFLANVARGELSDKFTLEPADPAEHLIALGDSDSDSGEQTFLLTDPVAMILDSGLSFTAVFKAVRAYVDRYKEAVVVPVGVQAAAQRFLESGGAVRKYWANETDRDTKGAKKATFQPAGALSHAQALAGLLAATIENLSKKTAEAV